MKIVFYAHWWPPYHFAGSEVMGQNIMRALQKRGHDVQVITRQEHDAPKTWEFDGIPVRQSDPNWTDELVNAHPDVVLTHHDSTPEAATFAWMYGVPLVQVVHNDMAPTDRYLKLGADLVVYNTVYLQEQYSAKFDLDSVVLHPPVYAEDHATSSGDRVTLVNLNEHKGARQFYALASRLPNVDFLAVEGGHGAQIVESWPNVRFQPQTTNMRDDVWSRTKILLMPSIYESYGMVGVEALASGIPVIANPTFGLRESLDYAGIFVDRSDLDGWQREIERLLTDRDYYVERSELARKRSKELDPQRELSVVAERIEELTHDGLRYRRRR